MKTTYYSCEEWKKDIRLYPVLMIQNPSGNAFLISRKTGQKIPIGSVQILMDTCDLHEIFEEEVALLV